MLSYNRLNLYEKCDNFYNHMEVWQHLRLGVLLLKWAVNFGVELFIHFQISVAVNAAVLINISVNNI